MIRRQDLAGLVASAGLLLGGVSGCSVGDGTGDVRSNALYAHQCWGTPPTTANPLVAQGAPYDLQPDFFAANPYMSTLQIRIQRGSDTTEVSDGLEVLIDDVNVIRAAIANPASADGGTYPDMSDAGTGGGASDAGTSDGGESDAGGGDAGAGGATSALTQVKWRVTLPIGVHPPGSPTEPPAGFISPVHMALYLQSTCPTQNIVLYAVDGWITFNALFDANPDETSAAQKLTDATFNAQFGDLSDVPEGSYAGDVPAGLQSNVTGTFQFYFERGQPGQPFP
jgi:hypothetical protein